MQITPIARVAGPAAPAPVSAPTASAELRRIATGDDRRVDIFAGKVLRSGVTNVALAGRELMHEYFQLPDRHDHEGLIGFLRSGDAWDAVELLSAKPGETPARAWLPDSVRALPGVGMDAIWLIADYGGDYSRRIVPNRE